MGETLVERIESYRDVLQKESSNLLFAQFHGQLEQLLQAARQPEADTPSIERDFSALILQAIAKKTTAPLRNLLATHAFKLEERVMTMHGPGAVSKIVFAQVDKGENWWILFILLDNGNVVKGTITHLGIQREASLNPEERELSDAQSRYGEHVRGYLPENLRGENRKKYNTLIQTTMADERFREFVERRNSSVLRMYSDAAKVTVEALAQLPRMLSLERRGRGFLEKMRTSMWAQRDAKPEDWDGILRQAACYAIEGFFDELFEDEKNRYIREKKMRQD
ncbi:MAG: hypothetical protein HOO67_00850 [Candidatus Peribacteraceae bacterium]|nr:hypothetical protein [Candidatus Peribacteraceae bacterium]